jgi:hypothetical protein
MRAEGDDVAIDVVIDTRHHAAMLDFYRTVLGLGHTNDLDVKGATTRFLRRGPSQLKLLQPTEDDDVLAALERIIALVRRAISRYALHRRRTSRRRRGALRSHRPATTHAVLGEQ